MKLLVGLGNPGRRYRGTRHNVGFLVAQEFAESSSGSGWESRFGGRYAELEQGGERIGLLLPETFMNRSGEAVSEAVRGLGIAASERDVLVVLDDLDLPFGRLRLRESGSDGGHRGLRDILERVGDVPRLRFGIGRSPDAEPIDFVLARFDAAEESLLERAVPRAADAVRCAFTEGLGPAMSRFNGPFPVAQDAIPPEQAEHTRGRVPPTARPATMSSQLSPPPLPRRATLADRLARPFARFMDLEVGSAMLLLAMAALALLWANSPWGATYEHFWHTPVGLRIGDGWKLEMGLVHWVNDGLMAIFFFVVGMEIKREMAVGELSSRARALLPIIAAVGGMVIPASIYASFHLGGPAIRGWGVPMATDIAFAVAALSVLGSRVPPGLRIFLLALAIVDDLGAVAVIAVFYTAEIHLDALALAAVGLAMCALLNAIGVRSFFVYFLVGMFVWYETHLSGVHATIAGVMLGLLTPTRVDDDDHETLLDRGRNAIEHLGDLLTGSSDEDDAAADHGGHARHHVFRLLSGVGRGALSPLDFLVNLLDRPVAFFIMPIFALANAGVVLEASTLGDAMAQQVALAVALGLVVGKPVGVTLFAYLAVRLRIAELPRGVNWGMVAATGVLAGIGFTVALFVTGLAFTDPLHIAGSKIGILLGSLLATLLGLLILQRSLPARE